LPGDPVVLTTLSGARLLPVYDSFIVVDSKEGRGERAGAGLRDCHTEPSVKTAFEPGRSDQGIRFV